MKYNETSSMAEIQKAYDGLKTVQNRIRDALELGSRLERIFIVDSEMREKADQLQYSIGRLLNAQKEDAEMQM